MKNYNSKREDLEEEDQGEDERIEDQDCDPKAEIQRTRLQAYRQIHFLNLFWKFFCN